MYLNLDFVWRFQKLKFDLHDEEDEKKRQYEECEDNHHKEQLEEFGGHGHSCGHCCGHCVVTVVVKY